jgi:hypothetical protein
MIVPSRSTRHRPEPAKYIPGLLAGLPLALVTTPKAPDRAASLDHRRFLEGVVNWLTMTGALVSRRPTR